MMNKQCLWGLILSMLLAACNANEESGKTFKPQTYNVAGKVEKGPFISGSTITVQPMDGHLQALGNLYSTVIEDDLGNFAFGSKPFNAPYAELAANGYFFNEVKGELSAGTLHLRALVDLTDETEINVNLLTHLKYQRVETLVAEGRSFGEANRQAQQELFAAFGLQKYAGKDATLLTITGGTDEAAALIAISSLLLADRSEAALTEYLAKLCREFGREGRFGEETRAQMDRDRKSIAGRLPDIREHISGRYRELGMEVEVKALERFFDWDNDGIAGNETLQEGEEVRPETTELQVPNQGGTYKISITSPVPVYTEPPVERDSIPDFITGEGLFTEIYEGVTHAGITLAKSIKDNILTLKVDPSDAKTPQSTVVELYDCLGNAVGEVKVVQEGNENAPLPPLGRDGQEAVNGFATSMAQAFSELNLIEQHYHHNKATGMVAQYIYPGSGTVSGIWEGFYRANSALLPFKAAEAGQLSVYQHHLEVFMALYYYHMVVLWGDVPYIDEYADDPNSHSHRVRTPGEEIFANLQTKLQEALPHLDEKRNESLGEINDFFFVSKDVARILLADIYMYQGDYGLAERLLAQVVANGFYTLDASNYNDKQTITDLWNNGNGTETIFATKYAVSPRKQSNITIAQPLLVPLMTYTDVMLSHAECLYKNGQTAEAEAQLHKVLAAKGISVSGNNVLEKIVAARLQLTLHCNVNFAFLKRNRLAQEAYGTEAYRLLLPLPESEILANPGMTQNPGY